METNISKETLQLDILNTEKELIGYTYLVQGFMVLSSLPENIRNSYRVELMKWERLRDDCYDYLQQLKRLESKD